MIFQIVTVRDLKVNAYAQPQFTASIGGYLRGLGDLVNDPKKDHVFNQHPEDFELYHIGEWNDANNQYTFFEEPKQLAVLSNLLITRN